MVLPPQQLPGVLEHMTQGDFDLGFQDLAFFMLIFARVAGVFVQAPLFGRPKGVPMPTQVGYALVISIVMFHVLPIPADLPAGVILYSVAIVGQVIVGLIIGYAAFMVPAGLQFAGEIADIQMDMSIAASLDPSSGSSSNLIRQFMFRLAILVWIFIHGDYFLFKAMIGSFELIPAGTFAFSGGAVAKLVSMTAGLFVIGLELAAPVLAAIFIVNVSLGLLNRASHQFNVFMISMPLKIMVGLGMIVLSLSPLLYKAIPNLYSKLNHDMIELILALKNG